MVMHPEISQWRDFEEDLELREDLKEKGQQQNMVFRKLSDGKLELLAGGRRFRELQALNVPISEMKKTVLENVSERDAVLIAYSENRFRRDLRPVEEARAFRTMNKKLRMLIDEIALRTKRSESYVRTRLELLELPNRILKHIESGEVPMGYGKSLNKLNDVGIEAQIELVKGIKKGREGYYGGIKSVEEADEFVEKTLERVKYAKELVVKYGPCPQCRSKNIEGTWEKNKLRCGKCGFVWHKETRDPWEFYELKRKAEKMGLKLDLEGDTAKLTPGNITEIMKRIKEEQEKPPPKTLRSTYTVSELLAPFIVPENLHLIRVEGDRIEVKLIHDHRLHFTARRHNYQTGEKSQIRPRGAWNEDTREATERVMKFLESLEPE